MTPSLSANLLQTLAPWRNAPAWHVAFSGGLDSTVLLHLLVTLAKSETLPPLSAVHIHHGLQAAAEVWPAHCQAVCDSLGVPCGPCACRCSLAPVLNVRPAMRATKHSCRSWGQGGAFTGQHRDDQAETLLFRLLRGAGVRGLAAMPEHRPLAQGHLVRPLLAFSRRELEAYAHQHQLQWIEDPQC